MIYLMLVKAHPGVGGKHYQSKQSHAIMPSQMVDLGPSQQPWIIPKNYPITIPINLQKMAQKQIQVSSKNTKTSLYILNSYP